MFVSAWTLILVIASAGTNRSDYDPLHVDAVKIETRDLTIRDDSRSRDIPIRVYLPAKSSPRPVVLFSHGLGGSRTNNEYLGIHWAKRGYVAVFMQHIGSDESVWKDSPLTQRMATLQKAANFEQFNARVKDVSAVLDYLETANGKSDHPLRGRLDPKHVGMSGHSFGAVTTQAVCGQTFPIGQPLTEKRISAAVAMSPSGPKRGADPKRMFGEVKIPWLLMTGTNDTSVIPGDSDFASRTAVYPALPTSNKFEVVFENGDHSLFSERSLPGNQAKRNPNHHKCVLALTTAFWDSYLTNDADAKAWLTGPGPKSILEKGDSWKAK